MKSVNLSVRITEEERQHLDRWALLDPDQRGVGEVVRRLIREERERERERDALWLGTAQQTEEYRG